MSFSHPNEPDMALLPVAYEDKIIYNHRDEKIGPDPIRVWQIAKVSA